MSKPRCIAWDAQQDALARTLLDHNAPAEKFMTLLGRTKQAAAAHVYYLKNQTRNSYNHKLPKRDYVKPFAGTPQEELIRDAIQRLAAVKSLTATICGDPAPGQSALDKKRHDGP